MLINCKECGKEISDTVKTCPHCGAKLKKQKKAKKVSRLTPFLLFALVSICMVILLVVEIVSLCRYVDEKFYGGWQFSHDSEGILILSAVGTLTIAVAFRIAVSKYKIHNNYVTIAEFILSGYFLAVFITHVILASVFFDKSSFEWWVILIYAIIDFIVLCCISIYPIINYIKTRQFDFTKIQFSKKKSRIILFIWCSLALSALTISPLIFPIPYICEAKYWKDYECLVEKISTYDYGIDSGEIIFKDLVKCAKYGENTMSLVAKNNNFTKEEQRAIIDSKFINKLHKETGNIFGVVQLCKALELTDLTLEISETEFTISELQVKSMGINILGIDELDCLIEILPEIKTKSYTEQTLAEDLQKYLIKNTPMCALGLALSKNATAKPAFTQGCIDRIDISVTDLQILCEVLGCDKSLYAVKYHGGFLNLNLYEKDYGLLIGDWFKSNLKNPSSLQVHSCWSYVSRTISGAGNIYFKIDYSATNGFGGTIRDTIYLRYSYFGFNRTDEIPSNYTYGSGVTVQKQT